MSRILVVDDEPFVLEILVEEFSPEFEVLSAATYEQAIAWLDSAEGIVAVVTDWRLGAGPDGLELLREVRDRLPTIPRIMVSGHVGDFLTDVVVNTGVAHACVPKPWEFGDLRRHVAQLLALPPDLIEGNVVPVLDEALDGLVARVRDGEVVE